MFGRRRHQQSKPQWREPTAEPPVKEDKAAAEAEESPPPPSATAPAPSGPVPSGPTPSGPAPTRPSKPAPKPDASAVLNRQPTSPVRPDQPRRNGAQRQADHAAEAAERKKLTVGRDIEVSGDIRACDRLVVEGRVEADLSDSKVLEVAPSGSFKGSAVIDVAEIAGRFEGDLTVRDRLYLRETGRVNGTIRYRGLEIESGGRIGGTLVELSDEDVKRLGETGETAASESPEAGEPAPMQRDPRHSADGDEAGDGLSGSRTARSDALGT